MYRVDSRHNDNENDDDVDECELSSEQKKKEISMRQMHKSTSISYYLFVFGMFNWLIVFHVLSDVQDTILTPNTQNII